MLKNSQSLGLKRLWSELSVSTFSCSSKRFKLFLNLMQGHGSKVEKACVNCEDLQLCSSCLEEIAYVAIFGPLKREKHPLVLWAKERPAVTFFFHDRFKPEEKDPVKGSHCLLTNNSETLESWMPSLSVGSWNENLKTIFTPPDEL